MNPVLKQIINTIDIFKEFIFLSVIITFILLMYFNYVDKRYSFKKYHTNIYNLFLNMDYVSKVQCSFYYITFIYILSILLRFKPLSYLQLWVLIGLMIVDIFISLNKFGLAVLTGVNAFITFVIIQVMNMLLNYLFNIYFNQSYLIIYILIGIALMMYCLFILVYQLYYVALKKGNYAQK